MHNGREAGCTTVVGEKERRAGRERERERQEQSA